MHNGALRDKNTVMTRKKCLTGDNFLSRGHVALLRFFVAWSLALSLSLNMTSRLSGPTGNIARTVVVAEALKCCNIAACRVTSTEWLTFLLLAYCSVS